MPARSKNRPASARTGPQQVVLERRIRETLPDLLLKERAARGLTQEQLAERAGIHWTTIGKIERGKLIPSVAILAGLAHALDASLGDWLGRTFPGPSEANSADADATVEFVRALPTAERRGLLPVLEQLVRWKAR